MLTPVLRTCPFHPLSADSRRRFLYVRCSAIGPVNRVLCKELKKNCQVQFDCAISGAVRCWGGIDGREVFQAMAHRKDKGGQDLLRQLQGDLPIEKRPFRTVASRAGMNEEAVLDAIGTLVQQGVIRKFGAILRHQRAGITRNAMVIWAVPPDRTEEAGNVFASFQEITHCYERQPLFEGRYNLFTMIHSAEGSLEDAIAGISSRVGISDYQVLESLDEFKKSSMEYF